MGREKVSFWRGSYARRFIFFMLADSLLACGSILLSFLFIFGLNFFSLAHYVPVFLAFSIPVKLAVFFGFRLYQLTWKYVGLSEVFNTLKATAVATVVIALLLAFSRQIYPFSVRLLILDFFCFLFFSIGLRTSKRIYSEILKRKKPAGSKRTVIIGAGNLGEMLVRNLGRDNFSPYYPVCFLDDDAGKIGTYIQNVKVSGSLDDLEKIIEKLQIEAVVITAPSLPWEKLKEIHLRASSCGIKEIKTIPHHFVSRAKQGEELMAKDLESISIEEVLGRQEVKINENLLRTNFAGKTILVTGSAGSIGAEIVVQLCAFNPERLLLYEIDETELFYQEKILREKFGWFDEKVVPVVGDIRDFLRLKFVFEKYRPEIIFHSAAYKHVPVMEMNPSEAVKVNILGTKNLCELAVSYQAKKFVLISTDKAVNPSSVMGATKRFCEYLALSFNQENNCEFIAVRFGNVLGSRGSVFQIFQEQIKKGGPVTLTHPEMKRYFMSIREAVSLVLQASVVGKGGQVLVLDMGQPVSIRNLAEQMINFVGFKPYKEIEIVFTGPRPGEKLFEEFLTAEEGTKATRYEKIYVANISRKYNRDFLEEKVKELKSYAENSDTPGIIRTLTQVVTTYTPDSRHFCEKR